MARRGSQDGQIQALEREIAAVHHLYKAGELCESTYRLTLRQLEERLAMLSRAG